MIDDSAQQFSTSRPSALLVPTPIITGLATGGDGPYGRSVLSERRDWNYMTWYG